MDFVTTGECVYVDNTQKQQVARDVLLVFRRRREVNTCSFVVCLASPSKKMKSCIVIVSQLLQSYPLLIFYSCELYARTLVDKEFIKSLEFTKNFIHNARQGFTFPGF